MSEPQAGELEYRSSQVASVSFPDRIIELIVMPYEHETVVPYHGRMVTEICSRGAYDGIESRNDRVRVNRDHDLGRTCGRAIAFHPSRAEGLVAELKISKTDVGEETLVLADDGVLDGSAGFALLRDAAGRMVPGAETWETRSRRRLNKLFLGHIALVPDPAYASATVLAVRGQQAPGPVTPTPNLDRLELERLRAAYAAIDARYG